MHRVILRIHEGSPRTPTETTPRPRHYTVRTPGIYIRVRDLGRVVPQAAAPQPRILTSLLTIYAKVTRAVRGRVLDAGETITIDGVRLSTHILQAANIPYQSCSPADSAQAQLNNCNTLFYRSTVRADGNKRGRVTDTKAQGLQ